MKSKLTLLLRIIAAAILLYGLSFKFLGAESSRLIFTALRAEPWGRWFSGGIELLAATLLLVPLSQFLGAALSAGIMVGAIASHIFMLGIEIQNDGGLLFALACSVFACSIAILLLNFKSLKLQFKKIF